MRVVLIGALNGAVAVGLGAFGAHALQGQLTGANAEIFQTAVYFQAFHAAVLVAMGALKGHVLDGLLMASSWAIAVGVLLFSFSLYGLAIGAPAGIGVVTPIGGGLLIIGWLLLAVAAARRI
ncbi:DUF423 domain-containing protein [Acuticoccus sp. MNP-M23]|uniref:DUF423 domain-containing protein n=1 Tax=Acuticoccus sp. MNP-M23 TaxID=3072793 RepID=UPI00281562B8|nr:DUF423 domain-containing protein [Acuticoccus sp. MNP-M23]WMS42673.1 DUF423 domain-containing protein [Acuticoccus sp. MNP-M23]